MPRPFELFSGYDFFSVFLPGLAASILAILFLPAEIAGQIGPLAALIPVLVLSFSLGQGLHTIAHWLEKKAGEIGLLTPHRELFSKQVRKPSFLSEPVVKKFKSKVAEELSTPEGSSSGAEDKMLGVDWKEVYIFVQSYVYTYEIGRSRKFQSIYSFCRSMMVLSIFFPIATIAHSVMSFLGVLFDRAPQYTMYFEGFWDFFGASAFLGIAGAIVFRYGAASYKQNFIRYLVSDFVAYDRPNDGSEGGSYTYLSGDTR